MQQATELKKQLQSIHRKSYPAYKSLKGSYQFGHYILSIDHVQGDPFASPSHISVHISRKDAGFPDAYSKNNLTCITLADHLTRQFEQQINHYSFRAKGSGKSGLISVSHCGQEILSRTACEITSEGITARFFIGFPANGRTINAPELEKILFDFLPACVENTFFYKNINQEELEQTIFLAEDQQAIREQLKEKKLVAFVADGAILPRESGISSRPMKHSVPFISPESLRITMNLPHKGKIIGMGIPQGITLIVGGGYHGKSTLLNALELGVYNHIAGDGREYVITDACLSMICQTKKTPIVFQQRMPVEVRLRLPALLREWKPEAKFFFWMKILLPPTLWCGIRSCRKSSPVKRNRSLHFSNGHRSCIQLPEFLRFWLPEVPVHFSTLQTQLSRWTAIVLWISHAKSKKSVENIL